MQSGYEEQTLLNIIFQFMCQKLELMKQNHLFKKGFVILLKRATFSDFIETRLSNYKPLSIRIRFPLFWRIFFFNQVQTSSSSAHLTTFDLICLDFASKVARISTKSANISFTNCAFKFLKRYFSKIIILRESQAVKYLLITCL